MLDPEQILEEIRIQSLIVGKTLYEREELTQIVSLKYLEKPSLFHAANNQKAYIRSIVWNTYIKFDKIYTPLDFDIKWEPTVLDDADRVKTLNRMMDEFDSTEKMWIEMYMSCDFNYSEIERRTKITRQCAKDRVTEILDKWKHLDIYLQP